MRTVYNFNENWLFVKDYQEKYLANEVDYSDFIEITLPHTFNDVDSASGEHFHRSKVVYRKSFDLTELTLSKEVYVEFEAIALESDVYINGVHLGHHQGGFSTLRYNLTTHLKERDNLLVVVADNSYNEDVYPLMADFTFCGGIYRNVNLIVAEKIHFDLDDHGSSGVYIKQANITDELAVLEIKTKVITEEEVRVVARIYDEDDYLLDYSITHTSDLANLKLEVKNPHLWQGTEDPYLHRVEVSIESFNEVKDLLDFEIGLRYFNVDPEKGLFLNGKHVRLNGVSRHQDRIDKGWAISEEDMLEDILLIKEVGANSIRLAHYQHSDHFYTLCDRFGFIIWAEIPFISKPSDTDLEGTNALSQMTELVKQVYNHSSVFFWGVENEIQIGGEKPQARSITKKLNDLCHELDDTRLTTQAMVMLVEDSDEYNFITDINAYNKYYGWYVGEAKEFEWIHDYHKANPNRALCISEYGSEGIIEYHNDDPKCKDYSEEYHALCHEIIWDIFSKADFLWATYVWNMFDFGANIRDEGGVKGRNNKGLVTFDRQVKKDAFYMYKASWNKDEETLHICSKRYYYRHNDVADIKVYTNSKEISLYVNGEFVEKLQNEYNRVVFKGVKLTKNTKIEVVSETGLKDFAKFELVDEPYEKYILKGALTGSSVENWFKTPDGEEVIDPAYYSINDTIGELLELPGVSDMLKAKMGQELPSSMLGMIKGFTFKQIINHARGKITQEDATTFNKYLQTIKK